MTNLHIITEGQGRPLVLFHGWGFDIKIWSPLLPLLTNQYQLYLVDLPGFGLTQPMEWDVFKSTLLKQLPERFALAGWSMGGLYATRLAIEVPERVTHLINISSSPYFIRENHWSGVAIQIFRAFYEDMKRDPLGTLRQFIALQLQDQTEMPSFMPLSAPSEVGLQEGLNTLVNWDLRQSLVHLDMPVLYMFGRLDTIIPRKTMLIMQAAYPRFKYILFSKAAHVPFLSHSDDFNIALEEFLQ